MSERGPIEPAPASPVFACPVCAEPLIRDGSTFRCVRGHGYDVAREGYVNLLLASRRHSSDPGYSREMIAGRRDLFDAGHYAPLADDIAALIAALVADLLPDRSRRVVLDAGCGEGYYLRRLRAELDRRGVAHPVLCGLDISKHGIKVAAKRDPQGLYAVAGSFAMPVLDKSVDVLLTHFSPVSADDFARVLPAGGIVLVGGPGEEHLYSFKQLLYDDATRHEPATHFVGDPRFEPVDRHRIQHPMELTSSREVADLLLMTPYYWSLSALAQERLATVEHLETTLDVVVQVYRRTGLASHPGE